MSAPTTTPARTAYLDQKRSYTVRRGADVIGGPGGIVVPRTTTLDALDLVTWWSQTVPALRAGIEHGDSGPDFAEWARCLLAVRTAAAVTSCEGRIGGTVDQPFPHNQRLWRCLQRLALAMDRRNVAPPVDRLRSLLQAKRLDESIKTATSAAKDRAQEAGDAINIVSDALAGGAGKVSAAAGRGAGEGAIKGALSAAAVPAAAGVVALVGGLALWRVRRAHGKRSTSPATAKKPAKKKSGGRR